MEIVVHKENLQRALGFVDRVTSKNASLPILSNLLLKTEGGRLRILATNLEVGVTATIGAKVDQEGQIAAPGRILTDLARAARDETIQLTVSNNVMKIRSGSYQTSVLCFDPSEYPLIPKIEKGTLFQIPAPLLKDLLTGVHESIALSDSRPELAGALVKMSDGTLTIAATDGFRLAERSAPTNIKEESSFIIPRGTVGELLRILHDATGDIAIRLADNQALFSHEHFEIVSRLIDGRYPDYQKLIPDRSLSRVLVRRDDLVDAVKVAALFSSTISDIQVAFKENKITISGKNSSKGEGQATAEAAGKGEAFEISLNYQYFLDGLKVMPTEKVILHFTGKGSPFVLRPDNEDHAAVYLIMPLRA